MKNCDRPIAPWEKVRRTAAGFATFGVVLLALFISEGKFLPEERAGVLWTAVLCFFFASVLFRVSARKKRFGLPLAAILFIMPAPSIVQAEITPHPYSIGPDYYSKDRTLVGTSLSLQVSREEINENESKTIENAKKEVVQIASDRFGPGFEIGTPKLETSQKSGPWLRFCEYFGSIWSPETLRDRTQAITFYVPVKKR